MTLYVEQGEVAGGSLVGTVGARARGGWAADIMGHTLIDLHRRPSGSGLGTLYLLYEAAH